MDYARNWQKSLLLLASESVEMKMLTYLNRYESVLFGGEKKHGLQYQPVYHRKT